MSVNFPNLFIVGAPKCGTTALAFWLSTNSSLGVILAPKEPMFFCDIGFDFCGPRCADLNKMVVRSKSEYQRLVASHIGCDYIVDASTDYLSWPGVAERVRTASPAAKIIVILRDPIDRLISEHLHLVRDGMESLELVGSLAAEDERKAQRWNTLFYHRTRSKYFEGVRSYLNLFGEENVLILSYEELQSEPMTIESQVCTFLGVERSGMLRLSSTQMNVSAPAKSIILDDFFSGRTAPDWLKFSVKTALGRNRSIELSSRLRARLRSSRHSPKLNRAKLAEQVCPYIRDELRMDVSALSTLLGREFNEWKCLYE